MPRALTLLATGIALSPCAPALAFVDLNIMGGWQTSLTRLEVGSPRESHQDYVGTALPGTRALFQVAIQPLPLLGVVAGLGFNHHVNGDLYRDGKRRVSLSDHLFTGEFGLSQSLQKWRFQETCELGMDARAEARSSGGEALAISHAHLQERSAINLRVLRNFWRIGLVGFEASLFSGRIAADTLENRYSGMGGAFLLGLTL